VAPLSGCSLRVHEGFVEGFVEGPPAGFLARSPITLRQSPKAWKARTWLLQVRGRGFVHHRVGPDSWWPQLSGWQKVAAAGGCRRSAAIHAVATAISTQHRACHGMRLPPAWHPPALQPPAAGDRQMPGPMAQRLLLIYQTCGNSDNSMPRGWGCWVQLVLHLLAGCAAGSCRFKSSGACRGFGPPNLAQ